MVGLFKFIQTCNEYNARHASNAPHSPLSTPPNSSPVKLLPLRIYEAHRSLWGKKFDKLCPSGKVVSLPGPHIQRLWRGSTCHVSKQPEDQRGEMLQFYLPWIPFLLFSMFFISDVANVVSQLWGNSHRLPFKGFCVKHSNAGTARDDIPPWCSLHCSFILALVGICNKTWNETCCILSCCVCWSVATMCFYPMPWAIPHSLPVLIWNMRPYARQCWRLPCYQQAQYWIYTSVRLQEPMKRWEN